MIFQSYMLILFFMKDVIILFNLFETIAKKNDRTHIQEGGKSI